MSTSIEALVEKVLMDVSKDTPNTTDINVLCEIALGQRDAIEQLAAENKELTEALEVANSKLDTLTTQSNLVQYADDANGY